MFLFLPRGMSRGQDRKILYSALAISMQDKMKKRFVFSEGPVFVTTNKSGA